MAETTNEGRTLSQAEALDKIRKLLAVAQDAGATPGEAEAALGRAAHAATSYLWALYCEASQ